MPYFNDLFFSLVRNKIPELIECGSSNCKITHFCDRGGAPICQPCSSVCLRDTGDCMRNCPYVYLIGRNLYQHELEEKVQNIYSGMKLS